MGWVSFFFFKVRYFSNFSHIKILAKSLILVILDQSCLLVEHDDVHQGGLDAGERESHMNFISVICLVVFHVLFL